VAAVVAVAIFMLVSLPFVDFLNACYIGETAIFPPAC
jgi:hypothetical protein